jgi:hypothetical protein
MYIPEGGDIRSIILKEAHRELYCAHPGVKKMYADMRKLFFWVGMKHDVVHFIAKCLEYQQVKADHHHPTGLLQPHDVPISKWEVISMDFFVGLPLTSHRHNAILMIVDELTKSPHFILVRETYDVTDVAHIFVSEVICLCEIPKNIISERDSRFTSRFWTSLQSALGTQLNLSTTYHLEIDGKTKRVNQFMEYMLRMYVMDNQTNWEKYLPLVEFTYNKSFHSSIGMPLYEALYGRPCRTPLSWERLEDCVTVGPEFIQEMEEQVIQIRQRLKKAQDRQKSYVDAQRTNQSYKVGDLVFIRIRPNKSTIRFMKGIKLSPLFIGPFKIQEKIGPVAYRLVLPPHLK